MVILIIQQLHDEHRGYSLVSPRPSVVAVSTPVPASWYIGGAYQYTGGVKCLGTVIVTQAEERVAKAGILWSLPC
jgi:hypothetical protein